MHFMRADVIYKMLLTPPWVPFCLNFMNDDFHQCSPKGSFGILP